MFIFPFAYKPNSFNKSSPPLRNGLKPIMINNISANHQQKFSIKSDSTDQMTH